MFIVRRCVDVYMIITSLACINLIIEPIYTTIIVVEAGNIDRRESEGRGGVGRGEPSPPPPSLQEEGKASPRRGPEIII